MSLITMTHYLGSQGAAIAQKVSSRLDLPLFDDAALERIAKEHGIKGKDLKGFEESVPGFFERVFSPDPMNYVNLMESVIYQVAHEGSGIILGHGAQVLLREFDCAFHIRVHAPLKMRIQTLAQERNLSNEAAAKWLEKVDDRQKGFLKYAFGLDWNDPSLYDLVINTGKMSVDTAADVIVNALQSGDFEACSLNALETMDKMALAKKARSAVGKLGLDLEQLNIEVPEAGKIHVTGLVGSTEDPARLHGALKAIPEAAEVVVEVVVFPSKLM